MDFVIYQCHTCSKEWLALLPGIPSFSTIYCSFDARNEKEMFKAQFERKVSSDDYNSYALPICPNYRRANELTGDSRLRLLLVTDWWPETRGFKIQGPKNQVQGPGRVSTLYSSSSWCAYNAYSFQLILLTASVHFHCPLLAAKLHSASASATLCCLIGRFFSADHTTTQRFL